MDYNNLCPGCFNDSSGQNPCPSCGYEEKVLEASIYLPPRTILAEKYIIGKVLGQGGFGITYLGWDLNLDMKLAIKEFFPQGMVTRLQGQSKVVSFTEAEENSFDFWLERFLREAKTLAQFEQHPNIVSVRDFFKTNGTAYMIMSYVEGTTLDQYLNQAGGKLPYDKAIEVMMPVMDALREVHEVGVMHRDISPDNIFIDSKGRVVLIDFGAARQEISDKSKSLSVILKAGYAPEEQYRSRGKQGPWTDVYAVAATIYRLITGEVPPDALDRLDEDLLILPSKLGVAIAPEQEEHLLRGLAIKAKNRYQTVDEFQEELLGSRVKTVTTAATEFKECPYCGEEISAKTIKCNYCHSALDEGSGPPKAAVYGTKSLLSEKQSSPAKDKKSLNSKKVIGYIVALITLGFLIIGGISLFNNGDDAANIVAPAMDETTETVGPPANDVLDPDYYIDYANGTIPLGDLPIGARVVDPGWEWEFRTGRGYAREEGDQTKPVTWIVVAHDHYDALEPHVTLLTEELIGLFVFDDSTDRASQRGSNHWGYSGTTNAARGLRPWLNSTGIHTGEGFYQAFSENFRSAVLQSDLPNMEWQYGSDYIASDHVFIPTTTELGDTEHQSTYQIGTTYPYFQGASDAKRVAMLAGENMWYWTRSPASFIDTRVRYVSNAGVFGNYRAYFSDRGVRPALNLKSDTLVSEINP